MTMTGYDYGNKEEKTGIVANIERYTLNDGFGVRTTVFLKGCPFRCRWCCNPETQKEKKELMFFPDNCIACGACKESCLYGALNESPVPDWNICAGCADRESPFPCVNSCYAGCRKISGEEMTAGEVTALVKRDMNFYLKSGGGVTISGGEPLSQPGFLAALLQSLRESWINTAIETCGAGEAEDIAGIAPYLDMVFFDLKCMDDRKHKQWTGSGNKKILENFLLTAELSRKYSFDLIARTPVIPGFNDSEDEIRAIAGFIKSAGISDAAEYELLPYHKLGRGKYKALGRKYLLEELTPPADPLMERLNTAAGSMGVKMCKF